MAPVDGILNVNKPCGMTSYAVVALVKRLTGVRRVGHAGTLDPAATGILPVCLGQGTRVVQFLMDAPKTYRAEIRLGVSTDTYDASGKTTQQGEYSGITRGMTSAALDGFVGNTAQIPPMYSALKHNGKPLYQLARRGLEIERKSRPARIYSITLLDWQPPLITVDVVCGKGTYIRSLAHDLGQVLGCGAHLQTLLRSRYGTFEIRDSLSPAQLEQAVSCDRWTNHVYPVDVVLLHWSAVILSNSTALDVRNGKSLNLQKPRPPIEQPDNVSFPDYCRAYTAEGSFLAALRFSVETSAWHPEKVFL